MSSGSRKELAAEGGRVPLVHSSRSAVHTDTTFNSVLPAGRSPEDATSCSRAAVCCHGAFRLVDVRRDRSMMGESMGYRLVTVLLLAACSVATITPAAAEQMTPPQKIKNVEPVYPTTAQEARVHGDVVIEATVGIDGKVTGARVITSVPLLDEPALAAVRQWEYVPAVMNGAPVPVTMKVTVRF